MARKAKVELEVEVDVSLSSKKKKADEEVIEETIDEIESKDTESKKIVKFFTKQEVDEEEGTVTAIISTDAIDRDGEVMIPKGADIENFLKNPVVLWVHNSFGMPIGKAIWIKKGRKKVTAKVRFAKTELAQEVFQMFKGGFLNAFSIGFIIKKSHKPTPAEIKKRPDLAEAWRIIDEWELLEFSVVPVPANQEALATAVKTKQLKLSDSTLGDIGLDVEETFLTEDEENKVNNSEKDIPEEVVKKIIANALDEAIDEDKDDTQVSFEGGKEFRAECVECEHLIEGEKGAAACDVEGCIHEKNKIDDKKYICDEGNKDLTEEEVLKLSSKQRAEVIEVDCLNYCKEYRVFIKRREECKGCEHCIAETSPAACNAKECIHEKNKIEASIVDVDVEPVNIKVKAVDEIEVTPVDIKVTPPIDVKAIVVEEMKRIKGIVYN